VCESHLKNISRITLIRLEYSKNFDLSQTPNFWVSAIVFTTSFFAYYMLDQQILITFSFSNYVFKFWNLFCSLAFVNYQLFFVSKPDFRPDNFTLYKKIFFLKCCLYIFMHFYFEKWNVPPPLLFMHANSLMPQRKLLHKNCGKILEMV